MNKERLQELAGIEKEKETQRQLTENNKDSTLTKVTITIDTVNDAFNEPYSEVARILKKLANDILHSSPDNIQLRDVNGNKVGNAHFTYGKSNG